VSDNLFLPTKHHFVNEGAFYFRVRNLPLQGTTKNKSITSDSILLIITEHEGEDKLAKDWLVDNFKDPGAIYGTLSMLSGEYLRSSNFSSLKLEEFIMLFPNTIFSPWAKLYLVEYYIDQASGWRDFNERLEYQIKAKKTLLELLNNEDLKNTDIVNRLPEVNRKIDKVEKEIKYQQIKKQ
jgi:hypothetical protein